MIENKRANPLICALICIFASSAWLGSFSLTVELSIFTQQLPEGWSLGSVITVAIQLAAIGPAIYMILDRCTNKVTCSKGKFIQTALIICTLCNIPLILFWNKTISLFGSTHSITLIIMAFIIGMANVSSEVIFMPYMIKFHSVYLPAYFIGAGLSALVPSIVAMAQGSLTYKCILNNSTKRMEPEFKAPRFSVAVYFSIMFVWMCLATISFYLINQHSAKLESLFSSNKKKEVEILKLSQEVDETLDENGRRDIFLLFCLGLIAVEMYTLVPNLQSYAALPYSQEIYFWSLALSSLAQPIGAFISFYVHPKRTIWLIFLSVICFSCSALFLLISAQSPHPILQNNKFGGILIIVLEITIFVVGFLLRTALLELYRDAGGMDEKKREFRLFIGGLTTQVCVLFSTMIFFLLINVFHVFKNAPMC